MRNNHSTVGPTGMLPKLYNADCSIFVWVTLSLKKVDQYRPVKNRIKTIGYGNRVFSYQHKNLKAPDKWGFSRIR